MSENEDHAIVLTLLALHGLQPTPDDLDEIVTRFTSRRAAIDLIYAVPTSDDEHLVPPFRMLGCAR